MIGTTIGNYVVQKKIGQGGMGAVYLAEHPKIHRQVAIKVLLPEVSRQADVVQRFFTEARSSSEIHNEHIIDILDFGELPDGTSYIIMEWLEGRSLREVLRDEGKLPVPRALHIVRGVGKALAAAHARGIVHRDLKPDNIFLVARGEDPDFVKVLDFGIAKLMLRTGDNEVKTQTGALIGTPSYMSPEQCRGQPVDQRTDIYALGVVMYQMLTGRLPFTAEGLGELLLAHMTQQPTPPRELVPALPPAVESVILKALTKDAGKRYQHIEELIADLGGDSSGGYKVGPDDRTLARPPNHDTIGGATGEAQPTTLSKKRRAPWALVLGGLVAAGGAGAYFLMQTHQTVMQPHQPMMQPHQNPPPPQQPVTAQLSVKTVPADAQLLLDEAPVANPFSGKFPRGDVRHHLTVKAAGYRSESQWIVFDADHELTVTLEKTIDTAKRPPETKSGKPIYKGTKGKLITTFPE